MKNLFIALIISIWSYTSFAQDAETVQKSVKADSLLETYSIEELIKYRDYYRGQMNNFEKDHNNLATRVR